MQQARTKEERQELVQLYKQSGMSARAFAEELKLNYGTFRTWLYKKQPEPKPADDNLNFVEVKATQEAGESKARIFCCIRQRKILVRNPQIQGWICGSVHYGA